MTSHLSPGREAPCADYPAASSAFYKSSHVSGLPEDVNLSPASLRPDLWLEKFQLRAEPSSRVRAETHSQQVSWIRCFLFYSFFFTSLLSFLQAVEMLYYAFSQSTAVTVIVFTGFFQTNFIAMETEKSAGSCPAPGQAAVRTWLPSSTRGTSTWLLLTVSICSQEETKLRVVPSTTLSNKSIWSDQKFYHNWS